MVPGLGHKAGASLARHTGVRRMSFTGSPEVGKEVAVEAARNLIPCKLELAEGSRRRFRRRRRVRHGPQARRCNNREQWPGLCTATRWMVHEDIVDQLVAEAKDVLAEVTIGAGSDPGTTMGPLVSEGQRRRVLGYIDKGLASGATALLEGGAFKPAGHEDGYFVSPALLTGDPGNVCAREERFRPGGLRDPVPGKERCRAAETGQPSLRVGQ